MAQTEDDLDLDLDIDEEEVEGKTANKQSWVKLLVFGLLGMTLLGGSVVGGLYFFTDMFVADEELVAEELDGNSAEGKSKKKKSKKKKKTKKDDKPKAPQLYFSLAPAFVVNFGETSSVRFLQITIQVGIRDPKAIDFIKEHMPAIRNNILLLLSDQSPSVLNTRQGKLDLRESALKEIRTVLEEQTGEGYINNVYFTSFVMQ